MKFPSPLCGIWLCILAAGFEVRAGTHPLATLVQPYPQGTVFPLQMYETDVEDVPALAAHGWNIFQSYKIKSTNSYADYLSSLATNRVTGLAAIPCSGQKGDKIAWPEAKVKSWVQGIVGNPNVAWWDLPEEARPWSARELKLLHDYTAWTRSFDPQQRPTYEYTPNNRNAAGISHIVPEVDVIGLSCYCEEMRMPHAWVRYKIQEAGMHGIAVAGASVGADYLRGQKTLVAILYCAKSTETGLMPTPEQTYHDFWSAIVSGARGIGVYAYHHAMKDDQLLVKNLQRLNAAAGQISGLEKIGDAILLGDPDPNVNFQVLSGPEKTVSFRPPAETNVFQYASINLLAKISGGNIYVIAVNSTGETVKTRFAGLPVGLTSAALPFENRSVKVNGGNFTDSFAPWGVHIYKAQKLSQPTRN